MHICERCGDSKDRASYELKDYCEVCSQNLCDSCMREGRCRDTEDEAHVPAKSHYPPFTGNETIYQAYDMGWESGKEEGDWEGYQRGLEDGKQTFTMDYGKP